MILFANQLLARKLAALLLLTGALAVVGWASSGPRAGAQTESMDAWEIEDVVTRLRQAGLEFRAVPASEKGCVNHGAFLTTTDKSYMQLNGLGTFPEVIEKWQGTVSCTRAGRATSRESRAANDEVWLALWGDCYLRVGPFVFFGDPELREKICAALTQPGVRDGSIPVGPRSFGAVIAW